MKKITSVIGFICFLSIFFSCNRNPLDIKIDNPAVAIDFVNIDEQFINQPIEKVQKNYISLKNELGDLFLYELSQNLQHSVTDSSYPAIRDFYSSEYISDLEIEKEKLKKGLPQIQEEIKEGFRYLSYYFSDTILPERILYINKLFSQITCSEEEIAVGLENYISPESEVIQSLPGNQLYQWQRNRMDIQFLQRDVLLAWIQVHLFKEIDGNFAEHIIQAGKILYVLNAVFPKVEESYILRYSEEDYNWAKENEGNIWNFIIQQQMLFKIDVSTRINFLNEGPTTPDLPEGAPDRIGQYMGYRIVKTFMRKNKNVSLQELLNVKYNLILQSYEIN